MPMISPALGGGAQPRGGRIIDGTARIFLAEALLVPTGLLTVAYLTRRLGPSEYGRYTLAVALITWLEWGLSAPMARAAVRLIGSSSDWRPVGALVTRTLLAMGLVTAVGLWFAAPFIAGWLDEPRLSWMLRLFALDLPLFALTQAHQQILVALGYFRTRALLPIVRWTVRLSLIVVCVEVGLSSYGAVLAIVGTSLIEIIVARRFVKPSIFRRSNVPMGELFDYAMPLLLAGVCQRVFDRVDIVLLRFLGRSAAEVGMYAAAQNLTLATGLFALAFSPVLLSTVTQAMRDGDYAYARRVARDALRCVLFLVPFAAVLAASSREIVTLLFGDQYVLSAQAFQCLIFAGLANVVISVGSAILIGAGKPSWTLTIAAPLPIVAIAAHVFAIPRFGLLGAAVVTMLCASGGAVLMFVAIYRLWQVTVPAASLFRSVLFAVLGVAVAASWPASGSLLIIKLGVLCAGFGGLLFVFGELKPSPISVEGSW